MPAVSVLMPVFNAEAFVESAIDSVMRSTLRDMELLVLDDGSSDASLQCAERCQSRYGSKISIRSQQNVGTSAARQRLLDWSAGRSEFIAWADADDLQKPRRFVDQVNFLSGHPSCVAVGAWATTFGGRRGLNRRPCRPEIVAATSLFGSPVVFPTFTMRSALIRHEDCRFDQELASSEDYDFVVRLLRIGAIANVARVGTRYRLHSGQESSANRSRQLGAHRIIMQRRIADVAGFNATPEEIEDYLMPVLNHATADRVLSRFDALWAAVIKRAILEPRAAQSVFTHRLLRANGRRPLEALGLARGRPWFRLSSLTRYWP